MFINFWQAAEFSENVKDEPVHVRMLGQDFVLFRDSSGKAHCLSNICVHRGGALAKGKINDNCIECPYHGWQFNGEGHCTRIPSMGPDAKISIRAKVDSYPVEERYGLVFCFLGDLPEAERPPILDIPEWDQEGWRTIPLVYVWQSNYERAVENSLDLLHVDFVHPGLGTEGALDMDQRSESRIIEYEWGDTFRVSKSSGYMVEHGYHGSNHHWTYIWVPMGPNNMLHMHFYSFMTPIDENSTRRFMLQARDHTLDPSADEGILERTQFLENQDRVVIENIQPVLAPRSQRHEILQIDDQIILRYRERLKAWEAQGWRIDLDRVNETKEKVGYTIPSPARRQSKSWTVDTVPLENVSRQASSEAAE